METVIVERLDHLGLVASVIKDLGIVEMIDARLGLHDQEEISAGEAVAGMILNGLGGKRYSRQHAANSARLRGNVSSSPAGTTPSPLMIRATRSRLAASW